MKSAHTPKTPSQPVFRLTLPAQPAPRVSEQALWIWQLIESGNFWWTVGHLTAALANQGVLGADMTTADVQRFLDELHRLNHLAMRPTSVRGLSWEYGFAAHCTPITKDPS